MREQASRYGTVYPEHDYGAFDIRRAEDPEYWKSERSALR